MYTLFYSTLIAIIMYVREVSFAMAFLLCVFCFVHGAEDHDVKVDEDKLEYAKGSLCRYCDYCRVSNVIIL